jgi:hypothetical protein
MTPEQFVYWMSGYMSEINTDDMRLKKIENALKQVRVTQNSGDIVAVFAGDSP